MARRSLDRNRSVRDSERWFCHAQAPPLRALVVDPRRSPALTSTRHLIKPSGNPGSGTMLARAMVGLVMLAAAACASPGGGGDLAAPGRLSRPAGRTAGAGPVSADGGSSAPGRGVLCPGRAE